jgi:Fe-S cluster biogenesis protein NfuA
MKSRDDRDASGSKRSKHAGSRGSGSRPVALRDGGAHDGAPKTRRARHASGMVPRVQDDVERVLVELIRPLIEADGGEVDLRSVDENKTPVEIVLVVGGAYRGCPGTPLVAKSVLEPAFAKALGRQVRVRTVPRLS